MAAGNDIGLADTTDLMSSAGMNNAFQVTGGGGGAVSNAAGGSTAIANGSNWKKWLAIGGAIIAAGLVAWLAWRFLIKGK
jgi:hypothetical protein